MSFHPQLSERMKVVDVISTKVYNDSQQIIAQVINLFVSSVLQFIFIFYLQWSIHKHVLIIFLWLHECFVLQGDLADCFYIVESGQVRITIKRSRVCFPHVFKLNKTSDKKITLEFSGIWWLHFIPSFFCQTKKDQEEEEVDIAMCSRGQYFGELALVTNKPRAASAYAVGSVKCLGIFCANLWLMIYKEC